MLPPSSRDFKDIYVVFELMETDLHQVGEGEEEGLCIGMTMLDAATVKKW